MLRRATRVVCMRNALSGVSIACVLGTFQAPLIFSTEMGELFFPPYIITRVKTFQCNNVSRIHRRHVLMHAWKDRWCFFCLVFKFRKNLLCLLHVPTRGCCFYVPVSVILTAYIYFFCFCGRIDLGSLFKLNNIK